MDAARRSEIYPSVRQRRPCSLLQHALGQWLQPEPMNHPGLPDGALAIHHLPGPDHLRSQCAHGSHPDRWGTPGTSTAGVAHGLLGPSPT